MRIRFIVNTRGRTIDLELVARKDESPAPPPALDDPPVMVVHGGASTERASHFPIGFSFGSTEATTD
jgi:hypothetical protein